MTASIEHKDILGQPLSLGNYVAASQANSLYICQIIKITPKMIRVRPIKGYWRDGFLKYAADLVVLSGPEALAYILRHSGS